jgi:hypothetical protein
MQAKSKFEQLEKGITERIKDAIAQGEAQKALELCEQLPKDFHNMYMLVHQAIRLFYLPYVQKLFEDNQGKLAEKVKNAVRDKDYGLARELLDEKRNQYLIIHETYIEILAMLFGMMDDAFGDEALEGAHRYWAEQIRKWYEKRERMSAEELVRYCAFMFSEHLSEKITIDEDEEKYTVTLDSCGSGGRLLRKGLYQESPRALKKISRAQAMTGGNEDYPVYCTHCQILFGAFPMENYGNPLWVVDAPKKPEEPCRILIYKDRSKIPEEYRRRWRH